MVFRERTYSVLVVSAGERFNQSLTALLSPADYWPVRVVKSTAEARRALLSARYDLVLINAPLPDDQGVQLAVDVCGGSDAAVLLFVKSEIYEELYAKVTDDGVLTLSKPASAAMVTQMLRTLCAVRERLRREEEKQTSVEEKIREIRLVNRAKWALIRCLNMTEEEAHRYIEKQAMDERVSRREMAERILRAYQ